MKQIYLCGNAADFANYCNAFAALGAAVMTDSPERCDLLLLPGGADVHPRFYGQEITGARGIDEARDLSELAAARRFIAAGRPILGICRGQQLLNVALGGTLHQHIEGHGPADGKDRVHPVHTEDAFFHALYGKRFPVNSCHHQSIDLLGEGLRPILWADDGCIEAVRHETLPIFAVQFHPERMCFAHARSDTVDGAALLAAVLEEL